jgi:excisionase family DNA binding protein
MVAAGRPVLQGMLTVAEVSKKLRITERHLRDLIDEGAITAVNVAGSNRKLWRIPLEELERFLNQRSSLKP